MTTQNDNGSGRAETGCELLRATDVAKLLAVSTRTVWRLRDAGQLPRPVRLGGGRHLVRWRRSDIEDFVRSDLEVA